MKNNNLIYLKIAMILSFIIVLIRNAWLCDDAFITLRTIDNFLNGYGLTWNINERVQAFTHPLWMFVLLLFYTFTHEAYYTTILLSIAISVLTMFFFINKFTINIKSLVLAFIILIFSKSFIDFSSSGLENPLSHLLLLLFLIVFLKQKNTSPDNKTLLLLSILTSLATLNRMDMVILYIPPIFYLCTRSSNKIKAFTIILLGFTPFIAWELFSLFYYGFLFPNTAYAKLNTGIPQTELIQQGIFYLLSSFNLDPITPFIIIFTSIIIFYRKKNNMIAIALGIILYVFYILNIGGDYMSGRFLTAPLFCSVILLTYNNFILIKRLFIPMIFIIIVLGLISPYTPIISNRNFGKRSFSMIIDNNGITDERACYYQTTGLLKAKRGIDMPDHKMKYKGLAAQVNQTSLVIECVVGIFGFYAGPSVYIVDYFSLGDPLLARLPIIQKYNSSLYNKYPIFKNRDWRIGHFIRKIPQGYIETLQNGKNLIVDKNLSHYYDKLSLIIKGNLYDINRLKEIWNMNTGKYSDLIEKYLNQPIKTIDITNLKQIEEKTELEYSGIQLVLGKINFSKKIELSIDSNDDYLILFLNNNSEVGEKIITYNNSENKISSIVIETPKSAIQKGFDKIKIIPLQGDGYYNFYDIKLID